MRFWPTQQPLQISIALKDDMKRNEIHMPNMQSKSWWSWSKVISGWDPRLATHVLGGLAKAQSQGLTGAIGNAFGEPTAWIDSFEKRMKYQ